MTRSPRTHFARAALRRPAALVFAALVAASSGACADGTLPKKAANDPANPAAAEAPPSGASPLASSSAVVPSEAKGSPPHQHTPSPSSSSVYACPMHPEVVSAAPGACPKCGMTLVIDRRPRGNP